MPAGECFTESVHVGRVDVPDTMAYIAQLREELGLAAQWVATAFVVMIVRRVRQFNMTKLTGRVWTMLRPTLARAVMV